MEHNAIETTGLSFRYGVQSVLRGVDLRVPCGSIYGYLGKNGAGKSTTIKLLLGLSEPSSGSLAYFGDDFRTHRTAVLERMGSLIESPAFYPGMSARENLRYIALCRGLSMEAIDAALRTVGLADVRRKKAKHFSTGMKQRLGIAMALVHDPDLIILDEPLNGLDIEGIVEVRELLKTLQRAGKTIFLSSHILSEIEKVCTHVGIIDGGRMIFQGRMEELTGMVEAPMMLEVDRPTEAAELCRRHGFRVELRPAKPADLSLETIFLHLTKTADDGREA